MISEMKHRMRGETGWICGRRGWLIGVLTLAMSGFSLAAAKGGPVLEKFETEKGAVRLTFAEISGGLVAKAPLAGFTVAGRDGRYHPAEARIEGDTVVVSSRKVPSPVHARYTPEEEAGLLDGAGEAAGAIDTSSWREPRTRSGQRRKPAIFLIGDSTVRNGTRGLQGWGDPFKELVVASKAEVHNEALGGRSSRTFLREGLWGKIRPQLRPGDLVLIQFGHNDGGPMDRDRARSSIKGSGDERADVVIQETGNHETVRSYGWYLRRYIGEAKAAGAIPVVISPVPRNIWNDGKVGRSSKDYGLWAKQAARESGVPFLDLNEHVASAYEKLGEEAVRAEHFLATDHTHTTPVGAAFTASIVARELAGLERGKWRQWIRK